MVIEPITYLPGACRQFKILMTMFFFGLGASGSRSFAIPREFHNGSDFDQIFARRGKKRTLPYHVRFPAGLVPVRSTGANSSETVKQESTSFRR